MDPVTIERLPTPAALATAVAERFIAVVSEAQAEGRAPAVVLTGGTIAVLIHQEIARLGRPRDGEGQVNWGGVDFWWGDERFVPKGDPDRNELQAFEAMLDHLPIDSSRTHQMPADDGSSLEDAAQRYADEVRTYAPPEFDIVMLGMGPDGHIASLFPGFPQLDASGVDVVSVTDSPKPPPSRISLTLDALNRTREVWFLVTGEGKADAAARAIGGADFHVIPASGITAPRIWFLDEAAASRL